MTDPKFHNSDLEGFAEYLGLDGLDFDLYYESYYELFHECYDIDEYDLSWETPSKSIKML